MFLVVIFISIKSWPQKIYVLLHSIMFTLKWLHVQKDMADLCCFLACFCVCMKHVLEHLLAWVCVSIFGLIFWPFGDAGTTTMESPLGSHTPLTGNGRPQNFAWTDGEKSSSLRPLGKLESSMLCLLTSMLLISSGLFQ